LVVALTAAAALLGTAACDSRPSPTIHDAAFIREATALCARELPALRAKRKDTDLFGGTPKTDRNDIATQVEHVADQLDRVSGELGALAVKPDDQGEVAAWLEEWANYTGIGRQYAAAVRTEKASVYTSIAAQGNGPVGRIARFARANRIDDCVL